MLAPIVERIEIPMPDGVVLRAHLARPASSDTTPVPLILHRTPYLVQFIPGAEAAGLDPASPDLAPRMAAKSTGHDLDALLAAGFAVAIQAVRGTDISEGTFRWMDTEYADGAATARWFADQPWCSGVLGAGASYVSATQFATVLHDPDALAALSAWVAPSDTASDMGGRGGVPIFATTVNWANNRVHDAHAHTGRPAPADLPRSPEDPVRAILSLSEAEWAERLTPHPGGAHVAGFLAGDPEALRPGTYPEDALRALDVPALHVAGWHDLFLGGTIRNYRAMRQGPAAADQHLVIGPWTHVDQQGQVPMPYDFGPSSTIAGGGIDRLELDFWRRHGQDAEVDLPRVRVFVMGTNQWRDLPEWPAPDAEAYELFLGAGSLTTSPPADAASATTLVHDPAHPVPTVGGQSFYALPTDAGPHDQRPAEQHPGVVSFSTEPLTEPLTALGAVRARLWVSSPAASVDLHAVLTDVSPDGYSRILTDGAVRVDTCGGEPVAVEVDLWATGNTFGPGHRVQLNLSASNWPRYVLDPTPHTITVHHDAEHPSALHLEVVPAIVTKDMVLE